MSIKNISFSKKIREIRKYSGYSTYYFEIKNYEYFLITTVLFTKEIIELIVATVKTFIKIFSGNTKVQAAVINKVMMVFSWNQILQQQTQQESETKEKKGGIESLFESIPVLGDGHFWFCLFKIFINMLVMLYFVFKYRYEFWNSGAAIWWIFIAFRPILDMCIKATQNIEILTKILEIIALILFFLIFFYICRVDKTLIDSWKLVFFENVDYLPDEDRYMNSQNSFISTKKIKHIIFWIFFGLISVIALNIFINAINNLITKSSDSNTKNQETLEEQAQTNKWGVLFSATILAPIIEEVFMRKYLITMGGWKKISIFNSSFIFALMHLDNEDIFLLAPYLTSGLIFGFIYWCTQNIWNSIFIHATHNFIAWLRLIL